MQLEHYSINKFFKWLMNNKVNKKLILPVISSLINIIIVFAFDVNLFTIFIQLILGLLTIPYIKYKHEKKKFVLTNRVKRIFVTSIVLIGIILSLIYFIMNKSANMGIILFTSLLIINFLVFDLMLLAFLTLIPIEKYIQNKFIKLAKAKLLTNSKLKVVAITGSYGKTSTKFVLNDILSKAFNVCVTPNSFNTPMGVTTTVNNKLRNIDEIFICEMGACKKGEIKELCDIVDPKIGILTSIGPQHLESFGSIKNIINTKFELIESLPSEGAAILNYDNYYIRNYHIKNNVQVLTYGIEQSNVMYQAINIHYGTFGSTFEVVFPNKDRYLFKTKLLGKHSIYNILAGIVTADYFKLNMKIVATTIEQLTTVEHRLQLINFKNYNIIDDSFNANIEGVSNAIDILNHFETKKIIITPGMIELGQSQYEHNYFFGEKIAGVCDYIVLVGKNQTKPIFNALSDSLYPENQIFVTNDFKEGMQHILNTFKENFTVLIENDLPDNYNEN
jgi:UDP-N-acetylmuramoyl-tripeptide--D-alanyl-D-alanine ligase